jgi:hypothetical protein
MKKRVYLRCTVIAAFLILAGCLDNDTVPIGPALESEETVTGPGMIREVPGESRGAGFLPLDNGNMWTYERTFDFVVIDDDGNVIETGAGTEDVVHEIIGTEERFGREYVLNQQTFVRDGGEDLHWWDRYRQDRSGLYRANIGLGEPPASRATAEGRSNAMRTFLVMPKALSQMRAAGLEPNTLRAYEAAWDRLLKKRQIVEEMLRGASPAGPPGGELFGESTTLRYPLHPGHTWVNRTDPFLVESEVEAMEVVDLPAGRFAGWRVRLENSLLDPDDSVLFWYSRSGLLGEYIHVQSVATDLGGNPIGTIISDETMYLQSLQLVRPGQ